MTNFYKRYMLNPETMIDRIIDSVAPFNEDILQYALHNYHNGNEDNADKGLSLVRYDDVFNAFVLETNNKNYQKKTFTNKLKKYCEFSGMTYNPADITKLKKDGERWRTRDEKGVLTPYIYIRYQENADPVPMNQAF